MDREGGGVDVVAFMRGRMPLASALGLAPEERSWTTRSWLPEAAAR